LVPSLPLPGTGRIAGRAELQYRAEELRYSENVAVQEEDPMSTSPDGIFRDPGAPVEKRVDDLLARMTIEEKVAQLSGHFPFDFVGEAGFDTDRALELVPHGLGQLSVATAVSPDSLEPIAIFLNDLQRFLKDQTRLGIPAICHSEALAGLLHA
jgi:hypothetical protein